MAFNALEMYSDIRRTQNRKQNSDIMFCVLIVPIFIEVLPSFLDMNKFIWIFRVRNIPFELFKDRLNTARSRPQCKLTTII